MQVAVPKTEQEFLDLIDLAKAGEEVIVAHGEMPVAQIIPVRQQKFKLGVLDGVLTPEGMPDFFEPMDEEDLRLWEGR